VEPIRLEGGILGGEGRGRREYEKAERGKKNRNLTSQQKFGDDGHGASGVKCWGLVMGKRRV
jgi:hypothetical protein